MVAELKGIISVGYRIVLDSRFVDLDVCMVAIPFESSADTHGAITRGVLKGPWGKHFVDRFPDIAAVVAHTNSRVRGVRPEHTSGDGACNERRKNQGETQLSWN